MLRADGDDGLVGAPGLKRLALPRGLSPEHLLFQDMKEGDDVSKAAGEYQQLVMESQPSMSG